MSVDEWLLILLQGIQLQQTLAFGEMSNLEHAAEVREVLAQGIAAHQAQSRINPKLAKVSSPLNFLVFVNLQNV